MYCSLVDVYTAMDKQQIERYLKTGGDVDNEWERRLVSLIQSASDEIDGYLRNRYTVPLDPVPAFIKDICIRIVRYKIVSRRGFGPEAPEQVIVSDYKFCLKQLEKIQNGEIDIGFASTSGGIASEKVLYRTSDRFFDEAFWRGYR